MACLDAIPRYYETNCLSLAEQPFALIVSGGVSMGERDIVAETIGGWATNTLAPTSDDSVFEIAFSRIHMKPGKPLTFGYSQHPRGRFCAFCLPGNPVSSAVCLHRFVLPALRMACGISEDAALPRRVAVTLSHDAVLDKSRPELARASLSIAALPSGSDGGQLSVSLTGVQRSSRLFSLSGATALVELPSAKFHGAAVMRKGSWLTALLFSPPSAFHCPVSRMEVGSAASAMPIPECFVCDPKLDRPQAKNASSPVVVGALTVSDRASRGQYEDKSGPAMVSALRRWLGPDVTIDTTIVPDERQDIEAALLEMAKRKGAALIVTSGGTGPAPRDITPEVTRGICDKELPGFGEKMRAV